MSVVKPDSQPLGPYPIPQLTSVSQYFLPKELHGFGAPLTDPEELAVAS